jgi:Holliday junction resolvase RusA-like endonuclease
VKIQLETSRYENTDRHFLTGCPYNSNNVIFEGFIQGGIINSVPGKGKDCLLEEWKVKIASEIETKSFGKFKNKLNETNLFAISISFLFCKGTNNKEKKCDIDNYSKPIIDAMATALFDCISDGNKLCDVLKKFEEIRQKNKEENKRTGVWGKNDHTFRWIYLERLDDVEDNTKEGVYVTVCLMQ